ncbi:MAG: AAA family ATPase, partial [Candidatus Bathyarchaeota archaeon]|nr:AAA family ATPase [Candidatus Bathyarchaeota archaeon]
MGELVVEKLRRTAQPAHFQCKTTEELTSLDELVGQERAVKALRFGLDIKQHGFNIYVAGLPGTGRKTAVNDFLRVNAKDKPVPHDLCYVNNFQNSYEPKAIKLPSGRGREFQRDMKNFVEQTRNLLPRAFESEDYTTKRDARIRAIDEKRKVLLAKLNERAQKEGFALQSTPIGVLIVPIVRGRPLNDQELMSLPKEARDEIDKKGQALRSELRSAMTQLRGLQRRAEENIKELNREIAIYAIGHMIEGLTDKYKAFQEVKSYLDDVQKDIL